MSREEPRREALPPLPSVSRGRSEERIAPPPAPTGESRVPSLPTLRIRSPYLAPYPRPPSRERPTAAVPRLPFGEPPPRASGGRARSPVRAFPLMTEEGMPVLGRGAPIPRGIHLPTETGALEHRIPPTVGVAALIRARRAQEQGDGDGGADGGGGGALVGAGGGGGGARTLPPRIPAAVPFVERAVPRREEVREAAEAVVGRQHPPNEPPIPPEATVAVGSSLPVYGSLQLRGSGVRGRANVICTLIELDNGEIICEREGSKIEKKKRRSRAK